MDREQLEIEIRDALARGDQHGAATRAVEGYGGEVLAFVEDRVPAASDAQDVFASFLENLWSSLAAYRGECSMRSWCYLLARRAIARYRRGELVRRKHELGAGEEPWSELAAKARSRTAPFLRTDVKTRARALRETLPEDDQQLLLLRLERGLSFRDIAQIMSEGEQLAGEALTREAARLRKRFQLAKQELTELLIREGLVETD